MGGLVALDLSGNERHGPLVERTYVCANRRVLCVTGDDRRAWLNGLVTRDVSKRPPEPRVEFALATTQKGKVLADVWAVGWKDVLYLSVPALTCDELKQHFDHHLVMEDAEIATTDFETRVVFDAKAPSVSTNPEMAEFRWPFQEFKASLALVPRDTPMTGSPLSEEEWVDRRIACEMKAFGDDYDENYYPQEASLRDAVAFDKGCYLGQEVVCMLELRGKVRRQIVLVESDAGLSAAEHLYDQVGDAAKEVGQVRSLHSSRLCAFALVQSSALLSPMWTKGGVRVRASALKKSE